MLVLTRKRNQSIVVNDNIEVAVDHINAVIQGHRLRLQNQKHIINEVLKKC